MINSTILVIKNKTQVGNLFSFQRKGALSLAAISKKFYGKRAQEQRKVMQQRKKIQKHSNYLIVENSGPKQEKAT